jgi:competence protein ComEC
MRLAGHGSAGTGAVRARRRGVATLRAAALALVLAACTAGSVVAPDVAPGAGTDAPPPAVEPPTPDGRVPAGELEVHFLDVGQGDAALLLHDEVAVLVDTGDHRGDEVVPALARLGVDRLDLVIVSHPHADHIGQFDRVLAAIDVDEVWWSGSRTTTRTFERAVAALERSSAAYEEPRAGDRAEIGPLLLEVLHPRRDAALSDLHDAMLVVRVTFGEVRFLFTGDAEVPVERRLLADPSLVRAEVLKVGHHGSRTSTSSAFLAAVAPRIAVYSAGSGNRYGHPHDEVVARIEVAGIELRGTDRHGTVVVSTDGRAITVRTGG